MKQTWLSPIPNSLWHSSDSYNVGAGTLPFLFRWGNTTCALWCMFYADKPGCSEKSRDISWATRIGEKQYKMEAYMLLRIGWVSQRIQRYLRLFHLRQYFNGKKIRRIVNIYGFLSSQHEFLERKGIFHDETKHDKNSFVIIWSSPRHRRLTETVKTKTVFAVAGRLTVV